MLRKGKKNRLSKKKKKATKLFNSRKGKKK